MTLASKEQIIDLKILRLLVVVGEGDVETPQHVEDTAVFAKLVVQFPGIHVSTGKEQHSEGLALYATVRSKAPRIASNWPIRSSIGASDVRSSLGNGKAGNI